MSDLHIKNKIFMIINPKFKKRNKKMAKKKAKKSKKKRL